MPTVSQMQGAFMVAGAHQDRSCLRQSPKLLKALNGADHGQPLIACTGRDQCTPGGALELGPIHIIER